MSRHVRSYADAVLRLFIALVAGLQHLGITWAPATDPFLLIAIYAALGGGRSLERTHQERQNDRDHQPLL